MANQDRQKLTVKLYVRRDGEPMIYVNGEDDCSIGFSEGQPPTRSGKGGTKGKRKLLSDFYWAVEEAEPALDSHSASLVDWDEHDEDKARLECGDLYITDVGKVGGIDVREDGAYLYRDGELYNLEAIR